MVGQGFNLVSGLIGQLQDVDDPQDIYSDMTRRDYDNYIKDFRPFEEAWMAALTPVYPAPTTTKSYEEFET